MMALSKFLVLLAIFFLESYANAFLGMNNDNNNMAGVFMSNIIKEENIAIQHAPLDNIIFAEIQ